MSVKSLVYKVTRWKLTALLYCGKMINAVKDYSTNRSV